MAKTKEELNELKEEIETLSQKLGELSDEEMEEVTGGAIGDWSNIEHSSGIKLKIAGQYEIFYGIPTPTNENGIPLPSDEKLKQ